MKLGDNVQSKAGFKGRIWVMNPNDNTCQIRNEFLRGEKIESVQLSGWISLDEISPVETLVAVAA